VRDDDPRWQYGVPPASNANFAWMQHMIYHLAPYGSMGMLLANGSMSSTANNEGEIRRTLIETDLVECIVALPGQLFTNTQIPACIWLLTRTKTAGTLWRNRERETLFIDARNLGYMKDRVLRDFTPKDIAKVADTFHAWRSGKNYCDERGFCKATKLEDIKNQDYVLTPGRYVGTAETETHDEPFTKKMARLTAKLSEQLAESARLEKVVRENLKKLGHEL
jgi:type I restriction enzyme M protein